VTKDRDRLAVSKETQHRFDTESFSLNKLNKVEGKEQYLVEISKKFASFENLGDEVDVNRAWETIRENIKISAKENLGQWFSTSVIPRPGNSFFFFIRRPGIVDARV
jgi:hypothetical protein